jgi:hypothetical protein
MTNYNFLCSPEFEINAQRTVLCLRRCNDFFNFELLWLTEPKIAVYIKLCAKWKLLIVDGQGNTKYGENQLLVYCFKNKHDVYRFFGKLDYPL